VTHDNGPKGNNGFQQYNRERTVAQIGIESKGYAYYKAMAAKSFMLRSEIAHTCDSFSCASSMRQEELGISLREHDTGNFIVKELTSLDRI